MGPWDYTVAAAYVLVFGFWLGLMAGRKLERAEIGNAAEIGKWLAKAALSVSETHMFAGDVEVKNTGKMRTPKGETFLVTVEMERHHAEGSTL